MTKSHITKGNCCKLTIAMLGDFAPHSETTLLFPENFSEVMIEKKIFQQAITRFDKLYQGAHIRFKYRRKWKMGWVTDVSAENRVEIEQSTSTELGQKMRCRWKSMTNVCTVPMMPKDVLGDELQNELQWTGEDGNPGK